MLIFNPILSKSELLRMDLIKDISVSFDRGHPIVLILTNNIQYFPSDTTLSNIHKNVITGLLVSVSQNHLSGPQY